MLPGHDSGCCLDTIFLVAFAVGLLSAAHCLGMCGGIMGALSFALPDETRAQVPRLLGFLGAYNLGRIASYAAGGAVAGGLGLTLVEGSGSAEVGLLRSPECRANQTSFILVPPVEVYGGHKTGAVPGRTFLTGISGAAPEP